MAIRFEKGDVLPDLTKAPITKEQLKAYAEASEDSNPIHIDEDAAKQAKLPGVIAHGMLTMGFMGEFMYQVLAEIKKMQNGDGTKNPRLHELNCRFKAMTFPGDVITVSGVVHDYNGQALICELETKKQTGEVTATGKATITF
ncbi:MAG: MaoC/PaaZ C-terminal domain-containing protein [Bacteriovoracia bacterium]